MTTRLTLRNMLEEIEGCAVEDKEPPEYVTSIEVLPPSLLQWTGRESDIPPPQSSSCKKAFYLSHRHRSVHIPKEKKRQRRRRSLVADGEESNLLPPITTHILPSNRRPKINIIGIESSVFFLFYCSIYN